MSSTKQALAKSSIAIMQWTLDRVWLKVLFSDYQWFRRLHGGRWELWQMDSPVEVQCWVEVPMTLPDRLRIALCRGSRMSLEIWHTTLTA